MIVSSPWLLAILMWCVTYTGHSTLLLGGLWGWQRLTRQRPLPAVQVALWRGALCAGFLTASLQLCLQWESPLLQGWSWLTTATQTSVPAPAQSAPGHSGTEQPLPRLGWPSLRSPAPSLPVSLPDSNVLAEFSATPPPSPPGVMAEHTVAPQPAIRFSRLLMVTVLGAWGSLAFWNLCQFIAEQFWLKRHLQDRPLVTEAVPLAALQAVCQAAGIRRPITLRWAEPEREPGACGLWHWTILVPHQARTEFDRPAWQALLAHELAHLVRGDQWWLLLGRGISLLAFWQPLNRYAQREAIRASETLCDARAIEWTQHRCALAKCLTQVAEWKLASCQGLAGFANPHEPGPFVSRVERLLSDEEFPPQHLHSRERKSLYVCGSVICLVMLGLAPGWVPAAQSPAPVVVDRSLIHISSSSTVLELPVTAIPVDHERHDTQFDSELGLEFQALMHELHQLETAWPDFGDSELAQRLHAQRQELSKRVQSIRIRYPQLGLADVTVENSIQQPPRPVIDPER